MFKGLRLGSMSVGLAVGVTAVVVLTCATGAYLYSIHHFETVVETARNTALARGRLIRAALEHQMMEKDRTLIERMLRTFGREAQVDKVMILDREGRARYSSVETDRGTALSIDSPTCQACHRLPPDHRTASRVIETNEGTLLRTMIPLHNREECHACHDPSHRINGVLILDFDVGETRAAMDRDIRWMAAGSGLLALLLIGAIAVVLRVVVTRRLQRFEATARRVAAGDLDQRVPVKGSDTLAWLGHEFNTMAETMTGLLREVREQREQLETVINGIDDGIVVLDVERNVIAANDAFLRRIGRPRKEVLGSSCHDSVSGICGAGDCPTQACLATGQSQVRICERRTAEGRVLWEEVHASPIRLPAGGIVQVVEVWRDISERRAAEARLAESHRLASLGMLASGFSHELNTPLATVLTCVEGIQRTIRRANGEPAPAWHSVEEHAGIAREQLLRCRGITQHFLRLARGQGAPGDVVDLVSTFTAVGRLIEPTARENGVAVHVEPVAEGLHVQASEAELQHVLLNLLLNAIQACARGGTVRLAASGDDPIRIRVSDDGCGIAPEDREKIFEPFFSARQGGTGLGLFLSLDFVRRRGGDIHVDSTPGSGTTFEITLPAARGAAPLRITS